jgi:hypothetical protein
MRKLIGASAGTLSLLLACSALIGGVPSAAGVSRNGVNIEWCSSLSSRWAPSIAASKHEDALPLEYVNRGSGSCAVQGHFGIQMVDAKGKALPFHVGYSSSYFKPTHPDVIILKHGQAAYELVAKKTCDMGNRIAVAGLRIVTPVTGVVLHSPMGAAHSAYYCFGGAHDSGNSFAVSVVTRSEL